MRKKSHICVARYLMNSYGMEHLQGHKKAMYIGSILPDCVPSFITRRHCVADTLHILKREIDKITTEYDASQGISTYFCRHLGVVTHYIADYFTFPHNEFYTGNVKDHCMYEKELKFAMREYTETWEARRFRTPEMKLRSSDEIIAFIMKMHQKYRELALEIKTDCEFIIELCHTVVDAILAMLENAYCKVAVGADGW